MLRKIAYPVCLLTKCGDTREKPYSCRCGATFTRRDLLTRHWRLSQHAGRGPSSESERLTQNGESESSDIPVLTNEHHVATPAITPIVAIDTPQHILTHHDDHDFHEPVPIFDRNPTRIVNTGKMALRMDYDLFDLLRLL